MDNSPIGDIPLVAMIGGGQLARMTHQAAIGLGQRLRILANSIDESAAQVSPEVIIGSHTDLDSLRQVADGTTVVTFDHEHVPQILLHQLLEEGINIAPHPRALIYAQDKIAMRQRLADLGMPVPRFCAITSLDQSDRIQAFSDLIGGPLVVKAARGGYDGRGVSFSHNLQTTYQLVEQYFRAGTTVILEEHLRMRRELSALVARSPFGQGAAWPITQTIQHEGICIQTITPAPGITQEQTVYAQQLALRIANELNVVGVLAVELFETFHGELLINELAMRPHNSGHWTIDGSCTSQFEQHLRAVLDYPLGNTELVAPITVMSNVLGAPKQPVMSMDERIHHLYARMPNIHLHLYGKAERPRRKIGHINLCGDDTEEWRYLAHQANLAAHWLSCGVWMDGGNTHE